MQLPQMHWTGMVKSVRSIFNNLTEQHRAQQSSVGLVISTEFP